MTITINGTTGITTPEVTLDNSSADGGQVVLKSSGYSDWNLDNYSGRLRAYYGGTEYFTINSSGNVGIGTSSPVSTATVNGNVTVQPGAGYTFNWYYNGGGKYWQAGYGAYIAQDTLGNLTFNSTAASGSAGAAATTSERMRIDSSGNLLVGTTGQDSGAKFTLYHAGQVGQSYVSTGTGSAGVVYFKNGNGVVGQISTSGTSTAYATSSDYRLKENIQPMQNALGVVAQLNPVTYTWKADGSDGQGFIAHELQAVVPDCVTGEKDAVDEEGKPVYQGIDTSFLVATLCKAIQEQQEQIEQLKSEVAALKGVAQ